MAGELLAIKTTGELVYIISGPGESWGEVKAWKE